MGGPFDLDYVGDLEHSDADGIWQSILLHHFNTNQFGLYKNFENGILTVPSNSNYNSALATGEIVKKAEVKRISDEKASEKEQSQQTLHNVGMPSGVNVLRYVTAYGGSSGCCELPGKENQKKGAKRRIAKIRVTKRTPRKNKLRRQIAPLKRGRRRGERDARR